MADGGMVQAFGEGGGPGIPSWPKKRKKFKSPGMGMDKYTPPLIGSGASAWFGGLLGGGGGNMIGYHSGGPVHPHPHPEPQAGLAPTPTSIFTKSEPEKQNFWHKLVFGSNTPNYVKDPKTGKMVEAIMRKNEIPFGPGNIIKGATFLSKILGGSGAASNKISLESSILDRFKKVVPADGIKINTKSAMEKLIEDVYPQGSSPYTLKKVLKLPPNVAGQYHREDLVDKYGLIQKGQTFEVPWDGTTGGTVIHEFAHHLDFADEHWSIQTLLETLKNSFTTDARLKLRSIYDESNVVLPGSGTTQIGANLMAIMDKFPEGPGLYRGITEGTATDKVAEMFNLLKNTNPKLSAKFGNPYKRGAGYVYNFDDMARYIDQHNGAWRSHGFPEGLIAAGKNMPDQVVERLKYYSEMMQKYGINPSMDILHPEWVALKKLAQQKRFHEGGLVGHKHKAILPQHLLDMTRTASMSNLAPHNMGMKKFVGGDPSRLAPHDMGMGKNSEDPYYHYNYRLPKFTDKQKPESLPKFALNQLKTLVDGKIPPLSAFSVLKNVIQRFESRETGAGVDTYVPESITGDGGTSPAYIHTPYYKAQKASGYGKLRPVYLDVKDYTSQGKEDRKRNLNSIYLAANELTKLTGVPFRVLKPENREEILAQVAYNPWTAPKVIPMQFLEGDALREERGGGLLEAGWWARNAGKITLPRAKQSDTWMGWNPFSTAGGKDVAMHEIIHSFQGHLDGNESCPMCSTTEYSWLDRHLGGAQGNHSLNPFNIMNMYGLMGGGVSNTDIESIRKAMGYYQYKTDLTPEEIKLIERKIQVSKGSRFANGGLAQNLSNSLLTNLGVPMFENGINMVPANMLALLHKNEAVVPANMNPFNPNASAAVSGSVYNISVELNGTNVTAQDVATQIHKEMRLKEMAAGVNRRVGNQ
jgi:hypothetical protein